MTKEFKQINKKLETRYVLEDASAGSTSASAVAAIESPLGEIQRRIKSLKEKTEKVSVPTLKPRTGPTRPQTGAGAHRDKKKEQKQGKEKHKKPFYEEIMDQLDQIAEVGVDQGDTMFLKVRPKILPDGNTVLTCYGGFANNPGEVKVGNATLKAFDFTDDDVVIDKIEKLLGPNRIDKKIGKILVDIRVPKHLIRYVENLSNYVEEKQSLAQSREMDSPVEFYSGQGTEEETPFAGDGERSGKLKTKFKPDTQIAGSSRGVATTGMVSLQAKGDGASLISGLISQRLISRDTKVQGNNITLRQDDYKKIFDVLGNERFQQMFTKTGKVSEQNLSEDEYDYYRDYRAGLISKDEYDSLVRRFQGQQRPQAQPVEVKRHYFIVPFADKDKAKNFGMRFDSNNKKWYKPQYDTSGRTFNWQLDQIKQMFKPYQEQGVAEGSKPWPGNVSDTDLSNVDPQEHDEMEGSFVKNQIHTMLRVLKHLDHALGDEEDLPEWVQMKISQAQQTVVGVMNFIISDKELDVEKQTGDDVLMKEQGVAEDLVGDVVVHNYTKMPIDLKPGQAQIHGWGPNDQPIYRVKGADGKEVITSNKKKMIMVAQGQGVAEGTEFDLTPKAAQFILDKMEQGYDLDVMDYMISQHERGMQPEISEEKIKGVDGKACWKGKRYAGKKKKPDGTYKDICKPVKEDEYINNLSSKLEQIVKR